MQIYAIFDSKTDAFLPPFISPNNRTAIREVQKAALKPDHPWNIFAADYTLFEIGTWNELKGEIHMHETKINQGTITQILARMTPVMVNQQIQGV